MDGARQKQVDEALARAFSGREPKGKCRAVLAGDPPRELQFWHYQHLLLVYDLREDDAAQRVRHEWWEKPTDLRILTAAKAALADDAFVGRCRAGT